MFADLLFVSAAILGALAGSITDLKERIIPNWITYSIIAFGLGGHLIVSLISKSFWPILYSLAGAAIFFIIAMLMFYTSAWAGGDTKMLIGLGSLLPTYPLILLNWLNPALAIWPFMFTLWINILVFGALIGLAFGVYILIKNWGKFIARIKKIIVSYRLIIHLITITALIPVVTYFLKLQIALAIAFIWAVCSIFFYLFIFTKSIEDISMYRTLNPRELTEGDWIVKPVLMGKRLVYSPERTGIIQKDINRLIKLGVKSVKVKEGLPMIPAFLLGAIFSLIFGDVLFMLFRLIL